MMIVPRSRKSVEVPIPPSTNNLFATVKPSGRRVKTKKYKDWQANAVTLLIQLIQPPLPAAVSITLRGKVNKQRDLDNCIKPVLDALVEAKVIPGDNLTGVNATNAAYFADDGEPRVEVTVS